MNFFVILYSHTNVTGEKKDDMTDQSFDNFEYWRTPLPSVDIPDDEVMNDAVERNLTSHTSSNNSAIAPTKNNDTDADEDAFEHQRSEAVSPRPSVMTTTEDDFLHVDPTVFHSDSDNDDNSPMHHNTSGYTSSLVDDESLQRQVLYKLL